MSEFMYGYNSILIVVVLFVFIIAANEAGYYVGRRHFSEGEDRSRTQTNTIQAAMLGLLALLLSFTFTMSLQRFDSRSTAVIDEANAIGTSYMRTQLLPDEFKDRTRKLFEEYVDLRLRAGEIDLTRSDERRKAKADAYRIQDQLWFAAIQASAVDPRPTTTGLFIQSLNELIDAYGKRDAALNKHVPEAVLLLLFVVFIIAGAVQGYAGGIEGARPKLATIAMSILIVLVIFIIIDLDRPRRGIIQVNQDIMLDLSSSFSEQNNSVPER